MVILNEITQGTTEWHDLRRCRVTGTKLKQVMGSPLDKVNLIAELIAQYGTELTKMMKTTPEMERGTGEEEFAIKLFERRMKKKVQKVGACVSDEFDWLMFSPDGLIADKTGKYTEGVEVKCPDSKTAMFYRIANMIPNEETKLIKNKKSIMGVPADYIWQNVNYFVVNDDLQKLYFVVYDERFITDEAKMTITVLKRSNPEMQAMIKNAKERLIEFRADWMRWQEKILLEEDF